MRTDRQDETDSLISKFCEKRLKRPVKVGVRGRGLDSPGSGQGQMAGRLVIKFRVLSMRGISLLAVELVTSEEESRSIESV
jgi:hypothetical protein